MKHVNKQRKNLLYVTLVSELTTIANMVLAETNNFHDFEEIQSRDSSESDFEKRLRDVTSASLRMDEREQSFHRKRSLPNINVSRPSVSSKEPLTPQNKMSITIMDPSVPFTSRNSAISKSYTSPRQYALSASHMSRDQSARTDHNASRALKQSSTNSMDYDEYEGMAAHLYFNRI